MQMSSFSQSPSCLQLRALSKNFPQELLHLITDGQKILCAPPLPLSSAILLMIRISVAQGCFFFFFFSKLSSPDYNNDSLCSWKSMVSPKCLGQVINGVQAKQCLGQVFCIRDLALFLFLAAYHQGFIKMCWY